jgi:hypothetical protein
MKLNNIFAATLQLLTIAPSLACLELFGSVSVNGKFLTN